MNQANTLGATNTANASSVSDAEAFSLARNSKPVLNGLGWASANATRLCATCTQNFTPEGWRNAVTGVALSLTNFDRGF